MESAETSSAGIRSAIASATDDLPDAVGPKMPRTRSANEALADPHDRLVGRAARAEVVLHRAVPPLDVADRVLDRLRRGDGDVDAALALGVVHGLLDPGLDERRQVPAARDVVLHDRVERHAGDAEHESGHEAGAVLARRAVDDDGAIVGFGDARPRERESLCAA